MDVFGSKEANPAVFTADKATLTFGDTADATNETALAQGVEISYQRNVTNVPLLNGKKALSVGVPQGTLTARLLVMGGNSIQGLGIDKQCSLGTITVGCGNGVCENRTGNIGAQLEQETTIKLHGCIASVAQISVTAEQGIVAGNFTVTFTSMEING
jgi:hypothetical protein